jgi:hypothetical protein
MLLLSPPFHCSCRLCTWPCSACPLTLWALAWMSPQKIWEQSKSPQVGGCAAAHQAGSGRQQRPPCCWVRLQLLLLGIAARLT